jgi:hypothetical protein
MHGKPTTILATRWLNQAVQYHRLLLIIFLFCRDYDNHHLFVVIVVKCEGGITITSYDPLLELTKFYSYEGFN